jgi:hypothetical protein
MHIVIEGRELPGRTFCEPNGTPLNDVHVGIQIRSDTVDLVRGDAASAQWQIDVTVIEDGEGNLDFRGPPVHGKRGERFLYLVWVNVTFGHLTMFRRAKLMLNRIEPDVVRAAHLGGRSLVGTIRLTDAKGAPRCARVDPPDLEWHVR